ncbi:MAG: hypothetical protein M1837_002983 [Sclerophora amabilis]|nr:MAG: hypothetical protein M1837_002983 [Sclerophora amabilis]
MPHKHRRERSGDKVSYELPPNKIAKPLSVTRSAKPGAESTVGGKKAKTNTRRVGNFEDDTPKSFARLMQFQAKGRYPNGLDDGTRQNKKRKRDNTEKDSELKKTKLTENDQTVPTILPGERLSDFAARVDATLPVSGLLGKNRKGGDPVGLKGRRTKLEKRMNKMQDMWREEERRRKEKKDEVEEQLLDRDLEHGSALRDPNGGRKSKKSKNGKKRRAAGQNVDGRDDNEDPWAQLKAARDERPARLHDVVQAPPQIKRVPKEKFRVMNGAIVETAGVPRTAGSLRRREELAENRKSVVERYRSMMQEKWKDANLT